MSTLRHLILIALAALPLVGCGEAQTDPPETIPVETPADAGTAPEPAATTPDPGAVSKQPCRFSTKSGPFCPKLGTPWDSASSSAP